LVNFDYKELNKKLLRAKCSPECNGRSKLFKPIIVLWDRKNRYSFLGFIYLVILLIIEGIMVMSGTILLLDFFSEFLLSLFIFLINKVYVLLTTNTTFLDSLHVSRGYREREGPYALKLSTRFDGFGHAR
jgi:hypothetical protein